MKEIELRDCTGVKEGDVVDRWLAGVICMPQVVTKVDDTFIYTGSVEDGWRFERSNGAEFDPELRLPPGVIASYIVPRVQPAT